MTENSVGSKTLKLGIKKFTNCTRQKNLKLKAITNFVKSTKVGISNTPDHKMKNNSKLLPKPP